MKRRSIMKKLHLAILLAALMILGGCVTSREGFCHFESTTLTARDHGKDGNGSRSSFVKVSRDTVDVVVGCSFVLLNPGRHEVHTTSAESWLNHSATTDFNITLGPAEGNPGDVHKYTIHVTGIGRLDPRGRLK
jgi:hypothetical protein